MCLSKLFIQCFRILWVKSRIMLIKLKLLFQLKHEEIRKETKEKGVSNFIFSSKD